MQYQPEVQRHGYLVWETSAGDSGQEKEVVSMHFPLVQSSRLANEIWERWEGSGVASVKRLVLRAGNTLGIDTD